MKTSNKSISASPIAENWPQPASKLSSLFMKAKKINALGILQSANNSLIQLAELDERLAELPNTL